MMKKRQYTTHTHTHTTTKTKEAINREGTEKNYNNSQKTINIKAISTFLPITALTVKGLNFTIKRMAEWRQTSEDRAHTNSKVKEHKKRHFTQMEIKGSWRKLYSYQTKRSLKQRL